MINPRSLVRALDKHWDAIEQLIAHGRDTIAFYYQVFEQRNKWLSNSQLKTGKLGKYDRKLQ